MEGVAEQKVLGYRSAKSATKYQAIENVVSGNKDKAWVGEWDERANKPANGAIEVEIKPGTYLIPNFSIVWGKRVIDAKTKNATGEVLFDKPWGSSGEEGYEAIEIRYAKNCSSLDRRYQDQVKISVKDEDTVMEISAEVSYVSTTIEPAKAKFFEVCSLNGDSICRNPEADIMFRNYNPDAKVRQQMKDFDQETDAMNIVRDAKNNEEMANVLADIFGLDARHTHADIISGLMSKMKVNPIKFLTTVEETMKAYSKMLKRAVETGILGVDTPGIIQLRNGEAYDILYEDLGDVAPEKKTDWLMSRLFEAEVYDNITVINKIANGN